MKRGDEKNEKTVFFSSLLWTQKLSHMNIVSIALNLVILPVFIREFLPEFTKFFSLSTHSCVRKYFTYDMRVLSLSQLCLVIQPEVLKQYMSLSSGQMQHNLSHHNQVSQIQSPLLCLRSTRSRTSTAKCEHLKDKEL